MIVITLLAPIFVDLTELLSLVAALDINKRHDFDLSHRPHYLAQASAGAVVCGVVVDAGDVGWIARSPNVA